ncbi:hypothetical protein DEJ50_03645 [Streptomyces venezuelae]|uniref:Uncharacterized protein n=1 Tax=Streptomyces venezuelae TaxID=54571 RepID=A0A5P2CXB4_STRVZ|nr:hypothetical protein [Streptomyces venezuelae]QES47073.1 hypothetical protein DEJ50_03645 [Streptomyces venezuelae]
MELKADVSLSTEVSAMTLPSQRRIDGAVDPDDRCGRGRPFPDAPGAPNQRFRPIHQAPRAPEAITTDGAPL